MDSGVDSGPVPAGWARDLLRETRPQVWVRRLYTHPRHGRLVAMESAAQRFPAMLAALIRKRDQICRQCWCDAPIRNSDHAQRKADGGPTSYLNGQGTCEACNQAKESPGWVSEAIRSAAKPTQVETRTPTGHRYRSRAPDPPRAGPRRVPRSRLDIVLQDLALVVAA